MKEMTGATAGINFGNLRYDEGKKEFLKSLLITIFAIHGNHEQWPYTIESYKEKFWHGGIIYYEEAYPNILLPRMEKYMILTENRQSL